MEPRREGKAVRPGAKRWSHHAFGEKDRGTGIIVNPALLKLSAFSFAPHHAPDLQFVSYTADPNLYTPNQERR
jgi:hypothetical protein